MIKRFSTHLQSRDHQNELSESALQLIRPTRRQFSAEESPEIQFFL